MPWRWEDGIEPAEPPGRRHAVRTQELLGHGADGRLLRRHLPHALFLANLLAQLHEAKALAHPHVAPAVVDGGVPARRIVAPHVREVIGTDVSPPMLAEAERQAAARGLTNVRFGEADLTALPFADASFDIVTARMVTHHLPSLAPLLMDVARVLKPGGQFVVVDVISPEDAALAEFVNTFEQLRDPSHGRDWSLSEWATAGETIGVPFAVVAQWVLPLDFADWASRQQTPLDAVAAIERMFDAAPAAARETFAIAGPSEGQGRSFQLLCALFRGIKQG